MLDWLIIGGGIHGTHLSYYLTQRLGVPADRLRVLDPFPAALARWNMMTANVGMEYLRSPHVHDLSYDSFSLVTFSRTRDGQPNAHFIPVFSRPSLTLFQNHSRQLIERYRLHELRIVGKAQELTKISGGWRVETRDGALESRRVMLAIGSTEQPLWPSWGKSLKLASGRVHHVFDTDFQREQLSRWTHAVVIGGGITAAQLALSLAEQQPGDVTLLMRHAIREHSFDSDPCWVTAICLKDFHAQNNFDQRRVMIQQARHKGSMPADVATELREAVTHGAIRLKITDITDARVLNPQHMCLETSTGAVSTDLLLLATGFDPQRPGGVWLDNAVFQYELPVAACGYPVVDTTLQWADGLHVSGPLAELEIGPTSRNIIGARLAGERLAGLF